MTLPETVQDYSRFAAQSFIQTAVFVDDRIYEKSSASKDINKNVVIPKTRKKATKSTAINNNASAASQIDSDEEDTAPDAYDIVNSFAKKQIVCSLYQPKKTASVSPSSEIFPLCRAADVVIVDWDLYGDKGSKACELADGLIKQAVEDVPEQLRLILVYTQELNLQAIANELYEAVHASVGDDFKPIEGEEGLVFHTENSRIVILGKPGRTRALQYERFVVEERDLAEVAVKEFSKLASGLLHAATLMGLAEIRKNSRKILSKFNSELDPAFLTHLAMSLPEEDASSHIVPLLVSEIEAVLEDALPAPLMPANLISDWCTNVWDPGDHLDELLGQSNLDLKAIANDICTLGFKKARENNNVIPNPKSAKSARKAAKILLPSAASEANHRLSHLMASRTFYGDRQKVLRLGSIVQEKENDQYLLCLQPICDSVRLTETRVFVFVRLNKGGPDVGDSASHIVARPDSATLELIYHPKSYLCFAANFKPDNATQQIVAKPTQEGTVSFKDTDGREYVWVDQLRASHAQRAVERFASDLSRVGLTESEWLRRLEGQ